MRVQRQEELDLVAPDASEVHRIAPLPLLLETELVDVVAIDATIFLTQDRHRFLEAVCGALVRVGAGRDQARNGRIGLVYSESGV